MKQQSEGKWRADIDYMATIKKRHAYLQYRGESICMSELYVGQIFSRSVQLESNLELPSSEVVMSNYLQYLELGVLHKMSMNIAKTIKKGQA